MTSLQSQLGGGSEAGATAEELAEGQRSISIAEFFEKNKQMLGFDSDAKALVTAVKEGVDNALDATEEAGFLPDIYVEIEDRGDYYRLVVEDNGPGITKDEVPKVFGKLLYGSRFHAREQSLTPDQRLLVRRNGNLEFVSIGRLCDAYLPAEGEATGPVPDDIEVPSFDREHETDEPTYEVTTQRGRTVEVTGNHSVFGLTKDGNTREMEAGALEPGDSLLAPRRLPQTGGTVDNINVLEYLTRERLEDRRIYVYGFDEETLAELRTGEVIRKKPTEESDRKRYYYRYEATDILRDSLEQNYLEKGYLPAETVVELGWEEKAADCAFRTYQVGGETTTMPVSLAVDEALVEMIAHYISEGHAGPRQAGFTFGSHETELIEATEKAVAGVVGSTTTVQRERNATRVKAFGSPLSMFLKSVCGDAADNKRIPGFVFDIDPELQERFIAALYRGDGSDAYPGNELSHTTTSETLARQLSVLWNMRGVVASIETTENSSGYADDPATRYRTKVYGEDVDLGNAFSRDGPAGEQAYKRIPTSLLDEVRVGEAPSETVPDSVPGLLMGAGVGSRLEHAEVYQRLIEDAVNGEYVTEPRYVHNLKEKGLLDDDHRPTEPLENLWSTIRNLRGFTGSDMCLLPVQNVERTEPPEYVYDISVPGATGYDENFVVANDGALSVKNSRGQQGIGISAAVLYAQLTSGKPARITSKTENGDGARYFELTIDTDSNEPEIDVDESASWERPHGTRIELEMEANMRARRQLHDYIQYTAVVNPHARIEFHEPADSEKFERATEDLPPETEQIRPHPHGVELGTLLKMLEATDSYSISGFLQGEFTRVGAKTAEGVCDNLRDRHFGREMAWRPPARHEDAEVEPAVRGAVANKRAEATAAFARRVTQEVREYDRVAHSTVADVVAAAADGVEAEYDQTFGSTVREKAVEAAWSEVAADRTSDCYAVVDGATTTRKDDDVVDGLSRRLAETFAGQDDRRNRLTREELRGFVDRAADATEEYDDATFGDTARENVTAAFWERARTVPDDVPKVSTVADQRDAAAELLEAMRETDILSPPTDCLAPIDEDLVEAGLRKEYDADFYAAATRDAEVHGGDPFVVEAGVAYGGDLEDDGEVEVLRFANRVPLVYQRGACATVDVLREINWRNYGLDQPGGTGMPNGPAVLLVHVASTNVPFTSESKDAVANIPGIEDEIELALREAARELKSYLNKRRSLEKRRRKQNVIAEILPVMADKLTEVTGHEPLDVEDSLARIMNNVLLERTVNGSTVELTVHNFDDTTVAGEVTEMVTADPGGVDDATVVEMDGEWFLKWDAEVQPGESATLSYSVEGDPDFDVSVEGIEPEKLTINA
ncbi:DNA topoisomerase VI subunit B [Halobacteriales archaeon QS_1_69_70]|nr:MAG: DNA topoisomerase VI subunit B [Halobacteriales archaeon QS_1_69_70]